MGWYCGDNHYLFAKLPLSSKWICFQHIWDFHSFLYPGKDKVLVPKGTKRVGSLVPVENDKKGVTLEVTASLLSSQLLPPFIIDTGSFGADLMTSWSNYTKSIVIFNKSHWMTQYAFIIYLDWLLKMFPCQRSLLIIDRSKTHFGNIITDWLRQIIHHLYQVKSSLCTSKKAWHQFIRFVIWLLINLSRLQSEADL